MPDQGACLDCGRTLSASACFETADGGRLLGAGPREIWTRKGRGICRALGSHALVGLCLGKKGGAEICWRVDRFSDEVVRSALEGNDVS